MSVLESIERTLESASSFLDAAEEDAKGPEGTGNAVSDVLDKIKEGLDLVAKFFTALDQRSWFDILTNFTETLEALLKLIGKFAGPALGLILKLVGKALTGISKFGQGIAEAAEAVDALPESPPG